MGNCQTAEAAAVLIHHPAGSKVDRIYYSVTANEIMNSNPGHYVAQVVTTVPDSPSVKQLKLLRPDDTLVIGQVYRLICFDDVLKEFAARKSVKLGKLLKESGALKMEHNTGRVPDPAPDSGPAMVEGMGRRHYNGGGQWRPALHTISELTNSMNELM